jgi:RNA polymerase sigma-70 factor (ECF subfamily)
MDYQNTYYDLGVYAHDLIRSKARTLIGKAGFTSADCEDIEQELAMDLLARLKNYDPTKSKRNSFMARVVEHRIATLLEERHAACRDWRLCRESLDDPEWQEHEGASSHLDSQPDPSAPTGDDLALAMDLRKALESLPADLRELWDLLLGSNMHRVARETGIPRATLYYRQGRLRAALREAGL